MMGIPTNHVVSYNLGVTAKKLVLDTRRVADLENAIAITEGSRDNG